jgi:hypothetical protein
MTTTKETAAPAKKGAPTVTACLELLSKGRDERLRGIAKRLGFVPIDDLKPSDFDRIQIGALQNMLLAAYNTGVADAEKRRVPCNKDARHLHAGLELDAAMKGGK